MSVIDFLDKNTFLLLEALLQKKCYLRELAEELNLAPSSVHKILAKLVKKKIVLFEKQKNRRVFQLNYECPLTTRSISLLFIGKIADCKSFSKLIRLRPVGIYLFGTAASGKMSADSDIDLAVFFEKKPDSMKISDIKRGLSNELKKEIQLIVLTTEKIAAMKKENIELLNQIKNSSLTLLGEDIE